MRNPRLTLISIAAGSTLFTGVTYGALYGFGPAEAWTMEQIAALTATVSTDITSFGASFGSQLTYKFENIISAVAVTTKQEALSANLITDNYRQSSEQLVNAIRAQQQNDKVAQAYLDYNAATGQGYDPCGTNAKNKTLDLAFENVRVSAAEKVFSTDVAPGSFVQSSGDAMQQRLANHREKFCTEGEAEAGLCTLSELPGGDVNASLLFEPAEEGSLKAEARTAYMQHVLGEPDQAVSPQAGGTPAGEAYMIQKNRKDSLMSIPAYSLAMVDAANTQRAELGGKSPNEVLKLRTNQYFGGSEAQQWSGSLARQTQRGLLVEANKVAGLGLWVSQMEYEQAQRIQLNISALLLASAAGLDAALETGYQRSLSNNAGSSVK